MSTEWTASAVRQHERSHPPGGHPWWGESWSFDFATADGRLGGYVRLGFLPHQGVCWYWAILLGEDQSPVLVVDHEVRFPRSSGLEIRTDGLWADHIVEEAFDHMSVGCEAFALRLDDPTDALTAGPLLGERIAFGLDLGWETIPRRDRGTPARHREGYRLPCEVVGEVLVGDERIITDATGWRSHTWGLEPWSGPWTTVRGRLQDGTWFNDDLALATEPVAWVPLTFVALGQETVLGRALSRFTEVDGRTTGVGWLAWNHPQHNARP